jgi:uncharacterized protein YcnI
MSSYRVAARVSVLPAAAVALAMSAAPAAAHVTISPEEATAGSSTVLTASLSHGCDGSPTTRITIRMPEQILTVAPTQNPSWTVRKVMEQLDEPVTDTHGNQITERVAQVVYTAKRPLPEGVRDAFELSLQLPDTPGETLVFPVIQSCAEGETAWVETSDDGSTDELDAPAPALTVLEAEENGTSDATTETVSTETGVSSDDASGTNALSIAALVAGLLGLAAGIAALLTARRRS